MSYLKDFLTTLFEGLHTGIIGLFGLEASGATYVLTIAIFTIAIKLIILPLNIKSSKSNARMQEIQPELNAIQKKYASDPKKMQEEYNKCMKDNKVSMMGGCLPSLIPLPVLFALYAVFMKIGPEGLSNTKFLWIPNVFESDPYKVLAILAFITTYVPAWLLGKATPKNPDAKGPNMGSMNLVMAGMMGFMALNFKAILVIYWVIGGVFQLAQTYFVNYLPAKKKQALSADNNQNKIIENAKKATPKTRKNN